jgi:hypothetical protein
MQYRPGLLGGFLASTRLDLRPFLNPEYEVWLIVAWPCDGDGCGGILLTDVADTPGSSSAAGQRLG